MSLLPRRGEIVGDRTRRRRDGVPR